MLRLRVLMASGANVIKVVASVASCMQVNNPFPEQGQPGSIALGFFPCASCPPSTRSERHVFLFRGSSRIRVLQCQAKIRLERLVAACAPLTLGRGCLLTLLHYTRRYSAVKHL